MAGARPVRRLSVARRFANSTSMARVKARPRPGGIGPYEYWALWSLDQNGGRQTTADLYDVVWDHIRDQFSDREKAESKDGRARVWKYETRFAVLNLKLDGRLKRTARGSYEISDKGREWLRRNPVAPRLGSAIDDDSEDFI